MEIPIIVGGVMKQTNQYGLSRHIPESIKRKVRQRAGFGCVICGLALGEYEHFDPPFKDAKSHDPNGITYLCPNCHAKATRGYLSKETIKKADSSPWCVKKGQCHNAFDISSKHTKMLMGGVEFHNCIAFMVDNEIVLGVLPIRGAGTPYSLFASFADRNGKLALQIINNEWVAASDSWDIELKGGTLKIYSETNESILEITCHPPEGLIVNRVQMNYGGVTVDGTEDHLEVTSPGDSCIYEIGRGFKFEGNSSTGSCALRAYRNGNFFMGPLSIGGRHGGGRIKLKANDATIKV